MVIEGFTMVIYKNCNGYCGALQWLLKVLQWVLSMFAKCIEVVAIEMKWLLRGIAMVIDKDCNDYKRIAMVVKNVCKTYHIAT